MPNINSEIFREYDVRGIMGKDLSGDMSVSLGRAFGTYLKRSIPAAQRVSVGRDVRLGSGELAEGLIEGIVGTGLDVYDLGICPTPLQYFSLFHLDLDGGVMVTGSHNPPEYNGFKLSIGKDTIYGRSIQELKNLITTGDLLKAAGRGSTETYDIVAEYKKFMMDRFSYLSGGKYRRLKIVLDAGNGTAGLVAPGILASAGCDIVPLYCEPDGRFPNHHPDPTVVEFLNDLRETTKQEKADIGIGYDGDADRIGVIGPSGNIIWGDHLMIILARDILKRHEGATIIGDVKCSQLLFDDIMKSGGNPIMWKTGHSLVKSKMKEERALLAGEFSGHIFIADKYFGYDDAIYVTLRLAEILKLSGMGVNEMLAGIPEMHYTPEIRMDCPDGLKKGIVAEVAERFRAYGLNGNPGFGIKEINDIDGIRIVFDRGWALLRPSNTQPVVVMRVEAEDEDSLRQYRALLEGEYNSVREKILKKGTDHYS